MANVELVFQNGFNPFCLKGITFQVHVAANFLFLILFNFGQLVNMSIFKLQHSISNFSFFPFERDLCLAVAACGIKIVLVCVEFEELCFVFIKGSYSFLEELWVNESHLANILKRKNKLNCCILSFLVLLLRLRLLFFKIWEENLFNI